MLFLVGLSNVPVLIPYATFCVRFAYFVVPFWVRIWYLFSKVNLIAFSTHSPASSTFHLSCYNCYVHPRFSVRVPFYDSCISSSTGFTSKYSHLCLAFLVSCDAWRLMIWPYSGVEVQYEDSPLSLVSIVLQLTWWNLASSQWEGPACFPSLCLQVVLILSQIKSVP